MLPELPVLKPLEISCTSTDCEKNLHCFKPNKSMRMKNIRGVCRECGFKLNDPTRMAKCDINDLNFSINNLKYEYIRHYFWEVEIDQKAINYAKRKGLLELQSSVLQRIEKSLAVDVFRDGTQTPMRGNPIYYAQHATATCCRKCIEYWYDIPRNRDLTQKEKLFFAEMIMTYIKERIPNLADRGIKIPRIRK